MTTRIPLPPIPALATLATHPVIAALAPRLLDRRPKGAMYEDSPYIAFASDPEPDDEDDGPHCRTGTA